MSIRTETIYREYDRLGALLQEHRETTHWPTVITDDADLGNLWLLLDRLFDEWTEDYDETRDAEAAMLDMIGMTKQEAVDWSWGYWYNLGIDLGVHHGEKY